MSLGRSKFKIKRAITRAPDVFFFFYPGQNFAISREIQRMSSVTQVRLGEETGGVKERMGSELQ